MRNNAFCKKFKCRLIFHFLFSSLLPWASISAEEGEQSHLELPTKVITATRRPADTKEISRPVSVITKSDISKRAAKTTAEALREESGVSVQKTSHGGGSANVRGLSSNQILLLVDGIRLNNSTYRLGNHQYLTTVDPFMIEQIEIVRGPNSVLYGSDALGGVIHLVTKTPSLGKESKPVSFSLAARGASADREATANARTQLMWNQFAILGGVSLKNFGDLRRGGYSVYPELEKSPIIQSPTGFFAWDADVKGVYRPDSQRNVILAYQKSEQKEVPRYDKYELSDSYRWLYNPQRRDLIYLKYLDSLPIPIGIETSFSYHRQEEGREIQQSPVESIEKSRDVVHTYGAGVQLDGKRGKNILSGGIDIYRDDVRSRRNLKDTAGVQTSAPPQIPNGAEYTSLGIFLEDRIPFSPRWSLTLGGRFSYYKADFQPPEGFSPTGRQELGFPAVTFATGVLFHSTFSQTWKLNLAQGYRAPNLSDLTKLGESKGNNYEIPNSDLEPEKMISADLGWEYAKSKLNVLVVAHYAYIRDLIGSGPDSYNGQDSIAFNNESFKLRSKQNLGRGYITGIEAEAKWKFLAEWSGRINTTATYGQNTTANEPIGGVPPPSGLAGVQWQKNKLNADVYIRGALYQRRLSEDDKSDSRIPPGGTPGWTTVNIRGSYNPWPSLRLQLSVENIMDFNYREHGSGINAAGRNFIMGLRYQL